MSDDTGFFENIPWCAKLMHGYKSVIPDARKPKASTEDELLAVTLNANNGVERWICLPDEPREGRIHRVRSLIAIGSGVNGYPGVCHGGIVATLMDESMGVLLGLNKDLKPEEERLNTVTAYLNTTYKRAVPTPSTILIEVKLVDIAGRKIRLTAQILDENGALLAEAAAMFVTITPKL